jgi:site-specific DNA-adenine methylase
MTYPGAKDGGGSYQQIISCLPQHDTYFEVFAGSAAVYRHKRKAFNSYLVDVDQNVCESLNGCADPATVVLCEDAFEFLARYAFAPDDVIYLDPPYLYDVRRGGSKRIYRHEMGGTAEHARLLRQLCQLSARVAISGYPSKLYDQVLDGWRCITWRVRTRAGYAFEALWMNYPEPALLHDTRYIGGNYIDRQRLRRLAGIEKR